MNRFELVFSIVATVATIFLARLVLASPNYSQGEKTMMIVIVVAIITAFYVAVRSLRWHQ
jgi:hypothetical protein